MGAVHSHKNVIRLDAAAFNAPPRAPLLLQALSRSEALPPNLSAKDRLSRGQWEVLGGLIAAAAIAFVLAPAILGILAIIVFWLFFSLTVIWRLTLTIVGILKRVLFARATKAAAIKERDLPVYSVLIALRHEQNMMAQLAANVSAIDWPAVAELVTTSARSQRPGLLAFR